MFRGTVRIEIDQYEEAIDDFDEVIRLRPEDADAFYYRGFAKVQLERMEKGPTTGVADLDEAIRLRPDDADVYYLRAAMLSPEWVDWS